MYNKNIKLVIILDVLAQYLFRAFYIALDINKKITKLPHFFVKMVIKFDLISLSLRDEFI